MRKYSLCVAAGVSASERKGGKKKEKIRRRRRWRERNRWRESRSREALCLWKRGKHGDKGHRRKDKALGQEAGLIAPGTQGHWIDCPGWSTRRRAVMRQRRCYSVERVVGGEVN